MMVQVAVRKRYGGMRALTKGDGRWRCRQQSTAQVTLAGRAGRGGRRGETGGGNGGVCEGKRVLVNKILPVGGAKVFMREKDKLGRDV